jgi:hypothetical protein
MVKTPAVLYKTLVMGIILLFIGAVIAPTIASDTTSSTTLDNDGSLLGYVNDTSGNPIVKALVRVYFHGTYEEDYSDSTGYYHVTNIPICYCLKNATCSKNGYKTEWVLLGIAENTTYDFILTSNNPPDLPIIDGPTFGEVEVEYNYTFVSLDMDGDDMFYWIDWGDDNNTGWIGPYPAGVEIYRSHSWSEIGTYEIRAKAKDFWCESDWSEKLVMIYGLYELEINGPTRGKPGITYCYNISIDDYDGDNLWMEIDWDDGTQQYEWYEPGQNITICYCWEEKGTYIIRAKATDIWGGIIARNELKVTIPRIRISVNSLFLHLLDRFPLLEVFLRVMNLLR